MSRVFLDLDVMKCGVLEVSKKPHSCYLMSGSELMHKLWDLVHCKIDVQMGKREILQPANYFMVLCHQL